MKGKNYIILYFDILTFPPVLTLIDVLLKAGEEVVYMGCCSNIKSIENFIDRGLVFHDLSHYEIDKNKFVKAFDLLSFKMKVMKQLRNVHKDSLIWLLGIETVFLFKKLSRDYKTITYFFEVPLFNVRGLYRLLCSNDSYRKAVLYSYKVVSCEDNRGQITKLFFGLSDGQNIVVPNKNFNKLPSINDDTIDVQNKLKTYANGRKIILYQGGFNFPERRLDELCECANILKNEYIIVLMGPETVYKKYLNDVYGDVVYFIPMVKAPYHLYITSMAYIGFITYLPTKGSIEQILNVLYCAPNKIFEYSSFGIPMIGNNLPALSTIFSVHACGELIKKYSVEEILLAINKIETNYKVYSDKSLCFYDSVSIEKKILSIL